MSSFDNILTTSRIVRKMPTVVFDIDGTLANGKHREHFVQDDGAIGFKPDWNTYFSKSDHDTVYEDVKAILLALDYQGYEIVIMTARREEYRTATRRWLLNNNIPYSHLLMREPSLNKLSAPEFKLLKLNRLKTLGYNVLLCFEDQQNVTQLLREHGYSVMNVRNSFA